MDKAAFSFDPTLLQQDLSGIAETEWHPHFNQNDYEGRWSSVALRSRNGKIDDIVPLGRAADFMDTPLMEVSASEGCGGGVCVSEEVGEAVAAPCGVAGTARALANICGAGLYGIRSHNGGLLVNYTELPEAMCGRLLNHFGLRTEVVPAMRERGRHDAKVPQAVFAGDEEFGQEEMLLRMHAAVAEHLLPVYEALERERLSSM